MKRGCMWPEWALASSRDAAMCVCKSDYYAAEKAAGVAQQEFLVGTGA